MSAISEDLEIFTKHLLKYDLKNKKINAIYQNYLLALMYYYQVHSH